MIEQQIKMAQGLRQIGMGLVLMAEAFEQQGPQTDLESKPIIAAQTTTAKAKAKADKPVAAEKNIEPDIETASQPANKTSAKKKTEVPKFDFEAASVDDKCEFLRNEMVKVSTVLKGDRPKIFAFLKKYGASKVNEMKEEDLINLHTDIQIFLGGPDALDI
jgi:hypothetical protein